MFDRRGVNAVGKNSNFADTFGVEDGFGGFGRNPERDIAIKPMGPAFLPAADCAEWPGIECTPNRAEDFMDVGDGICIRPPGGEPGDAVVLVDDEVEWLLSAIPAFGFKNRGAAATAANDLDVLNVFLAGATVEVIGEPGDFMATLFQVMKISKA